MMAAACTSITCLHQSGSLHNASRRASSKCSNIQHLQSEHKVRRAQAQPASRQPSGSHAALRVVFVGPCSDAEPPLLGLDVRHPHGDVKRQRRRELRFRARQPETNMLAVVNACASELAARAVKGWHAVTFPEMSESAAERLHGSPACSHACRIRSMSNVDSAVTLLTMWRPTRDTPAAMELEQVQDWQPVRQLQHVVDMNLQEQRLTLLLGVELNSWSSRSG